MGAWGYFANVGITSMMELEANDGNSLLLVIQHWQSNPQAPQVRKRHFACLTPTLVKKLHSMQHGALFFSPF